MADKQTVASSCSLILVLTATLTSDPPPQPGGAARSAPWGSSPFAHAKVSGHCSVVHDAPVAEPGGVQLAGIVKGHCAERVKSSGGPRVEPATELMHLQLGGTCCMELSSFGCTEPGLEQDPVRTSKRVQGGA